MNHSKIRVSSRYAGIDRQYLTESALGFIELARMQRRFPGFK